MDIQGSFEDAQGCFVEVYGSFGGSFVDVYLPAIHCNTLQHPATHCNTLQHTATPFCAATPCCAIQKELQCVAVCCSRSVCCSVLQCVAVIQCVAVCCNVHCNTLCVAAPCVRVNTTMQHTRRCGVLPHCNTLGVAVYTLQHNATH